MLSWVESGWFRVKHAMTPGGLVPKPAAEYGNDRKGSPERFGYSWNRFHEITREQEQQFLLWTTNIPKEDWTGKRFLDAGCGAGRNSYWPMSYGAASCVAADLDERSLQAARENLARFSTAEVRRCSIYD